MFNWGINARLQKLENENRILRSKLYYLADKIEKISCKIGDHDMYKVQSINGNAYVCINCFKQINKTPEGNVVPIR